MPTQCSAWSLLCLEENPSDNGCHQEKDGEVGGNDGHRAHGRSNIELPARSEIISKIWICNHERWQLGQCFASSKFRNHLTQNVPIWRTGKDKEVFPGFYNFTFAGDTIPTATFGGYLLTATSICINSTVNDTNVPNLVHTGLRLPCKEHQHSKGTNDSIVAAVWTHFHQADNAWQLYHF